jgi:hypothetical protein
LVMSMGPFFRVAGILQTFTICAWNLWLWLCDIDLVIWVQWYRFSAGARHPTAMDGGSVENAGAIHRPCR